MYSAILLTHSWLRWAVVLLALAAVLRGIGGWTKGRPWTAGDDTLGRLLIIVVDTQVLLGLLLYFVYSPYTALARSDFGNAMRSADLRFWAVEHVAIALVGVALLHIGRARVRKTADARRKHRLSVIFYGLALLAFAAAIPWPGTPNARPLFPTR